MQIKRLEISGFKSLKKLNSRLCKSQMREGKTF